MRLSWLTPLPSDHNDPEIPPGLERYLRELLPALGSTVDVTVFTRQHHWSSWIDDWVTVKPITAKNSFWPEIHQRDLCVYHLADEPRTFAQYFDLSRTQPGLLVLHEASVHSLVAYTWVKFLREPRIYLEILRRYAGEESLEIGQRWLGEDLRWDRRPRDTPLLDYALESALAAAVHSPTPGLLPDDPEGPPGSALALPYAAGAFAPRSREPGASRRVRLLTGPAIDLFPMLSVLATHPIRERLKLDLVAGSDQHPNLREALSELHMGAQTQLFEDGEEIREDAGLVLDFRGHGDDSAFLYGLLDAFADASAVGTSLPEDHPWVRRGIVFGLRSSHPGDDLRRQLDLLHNRPESLWEMGERAREHLLRRHDPGVYLGKFLELAERAAAEQTRAACRRFAHRMAARLDWPAADTRRDLQSGISEFLTELSSEALGPRSPSMRQASKKPGGSAISDPAVLDRLREELAAEKKERASADLRLAELERRVGELTEASSRTPVMESLDRYYLAFEERFRGSRENVKQRLEVYGRQLLETTTRFPGELCIDLGCGRGEWLEILRSQGLEALGVDSNPAMCEASRELGFEVIEADGLEHLKSCEADSAALITGFHVIEHLPSFEGLLRLIEESLRVLLPGGLAIFESPNPENLTVGACSFYLDHTHRKPLHPESTGLLMDAAGFEQVEVPRLVHARGTESPFETPPADAPMAGELEKVFRLLNNHLLSAPDFAVIGRKPHADDGD